MIVFELICPGQHRFEGWFASAEDFDGQKARGYLSCPVCSNSRIEKLPTAKIKKAENLPAPAAPSQTPQSDGPGHTQAAARTVELNELIDYVLLNTENVGREFPAEARRIHEKKTPLRNIRGIATREEAQALIEEGIPVMALPIPPKSDWH